MASTTFTSHANDMTADANAVTGQDKYARIIKLFFQRNMKNLKLIKDANVVIPSRTVTNPSPQKKTAANRHPGQTHTCSEINGALNQELAMARFLMPDLADHVFGHIVSTRLARDILQKFVETKIIQVFKGSTPSRNLNSLLNPGSDEALRAVEEAFEDADYYDCIRPGSESDGGNADSSSTSAKGKGKRKEETYSYRWTKFPSEPLREDQLAAFLNEVTDRAFEFARPSLAVANPKLHHRFAAPQDKHHAVPLSYEPDGQDMRPDFLLLPIEAFSEDFKTVDEKYVNFTAARLVGESKNRDLAAGVKQMQQYARGLRLAQPWIYYVLGLTVTRDKVVLLRGEGSGTERLELMMTDGRGCIEFIRILLGLALADKEDLGHSPDVVLERKEQACKARNAARGGKARTVKRKAEKAETISVSNLQRKINYVAQPLAGHSEPTVSHPKESSSSKRVYAEIADEFEEGRQSKKCKTQNGEEDVKRFIFYPIAVYGHKCLGILFTAGSIRGRGTMVFCVVDLKDNKTLLALKMAWQDVARAIEQEAVMKRLKDNKPHPNLIVPVRTYKVEKNGETCTTLGSIRGFLDDDIGTLGVENRVLTISISELKRPVKYFWGVHDFVRGLRGALLGHEYLTKIGILHRDISENNIVLGLRPEVERGYLIDLDMAILQDAEEPTPLEPVQPHVLFSTRSSRKSPRPLEHNDEKVMKAIRTGTFPYISYNVLFGGKHTQFDDVESFLYVLLLFFFSYAGPLSASELRKAHEEGFSHSIGSDRLPHMRDWPEEYANWAYGHLRLIGGQKHFCLTHPDGAADIIQSAEFVDCLTNAWPNGLETPICDLIENSIWMFYNSTLRTAGKVSRTEVSHAEFINLLDTWLDLYAALEEEFSSCPFK